MSCRHEYPSDPWEWHGPCFPCRQNRARLTALRELAQTTTDPDQLAAIEAETEVLEDLI